MCNKKTALLISNRKPDAAGGRAEKIATRIRLLDDRGWSVKVGHAPEPYIKNFPSAFQQMKKLASRTNPDLIVSINNPFHLHLHGFLLSRVTGTPWLAELRDPIYSHPDREPTSPRTWAARLTEELVVRTADQIVWHDGIQLSDDYFQQQYPSIPQNRFFKLPPMGYEAEKFEDADAVEYDRFTVTYAGSFYDGWIEPHTFLEGLGTYRKQGGNPLVAQFYGDWSEDYQRAARDADVADWIETYDPVPHEQIVPVLKGSDLLLYIGGDDSGNHLNLPSKLWDYVGAGRPILAIVDTQFRAAEFIRNHDLGKVVQPGDDKAVADALASIRDEEIDSVDTIKSFTREQSADALAEVMDAVAAGKAVTRSERQS